LINTLSAKPHLLALYVDQCLSSARKRPAASTIDTDRVTHRARFVEPDSAPPPRNLEHLDGAFERGHSKESFRPSPVQRAVHEGIIAPTYRGTLASTYIDLNFSSRATEFKPDIAVLHRLFDFQFGRRGLSIAYFELLDQDALTDWLQSNQSTTTTAKSQPLPARPTINRLQELRDNLTVLEIFALEFFNRTTCDLIGAAVVFSKKITTLISWQPGDISRLVMWFDGVFEEYRQAVESWVTTQNDVRDSVRLRFNTADPTFIMLLFNIQSRRTANVDPTRPPRRPEVPPAHGAKQKKSKVPPEVIAALPKHNGRSVCMKFLSNEGCKSSDPGRCLFRNLVHADVKVTSPIVRRYIEEHHRGVREDLD
jgi:hypothetical protein